MDTFDMEATAVSLVFALALIGYFKTKTAGFGKYTTATLLFILVLYVCTLAFFQGKIDGVSLVNLLAAVAGFAGGLFAARDSTAT
jgi:hypothetical protein